MDEQLRVGLVGAGPWAEMIHAPGIANHPGTTLTGVWARRQEAAASLAASFGAEPFEDYTAMLSTVDAIAFCVPPGVQGPMAIEAARAGKHLVLEKPIAESVEVAEELAAAVAEAGVASLVVLTRRYAPETKQMLAQLHRTGGWTGADSRWISGALLDGPFSNSPWRHDKGALDDVGPHAFDLLDAALGEITDVLAANVTDTGLWQLILQHAGGATSTVSLCLSLPMQPPFADFTVFGTEGHRTLTNRDTPALECFTNLLDDFVAMADSGTTTHECDVRRGLHLQRIIDLARRKAGA
ncbi:Gfo/Idh/MocA family oxidoreductase [Lentzea sp. NBC_00516]|uniref:Gfo/Idh/MocA family protein n=1 Tax=Lentzea sp. NBC_00516 TaxID=2903582 RepID=UPI002E80D49F|nr:Gfo/Idh/MocA family oxidoreductase [Lentzea sp. NBC_00516]WUD22533.1 Gfo/Idh/MocA family oxidoreductase [Lentzea sp. NBC_00516]